jgi:hypothetical protein|tara:strand:+ start:734 stop:1360 length:627 start_codon:yes stop_codon:yes gene_type:complete
MTKLCPRGKAAAKRKFKVYPSAYANAYASRICAGKIKDPSGVKRKDFRGRKGAFNGGSMQDDNKRDVRKVEQMTGGAASSKREIGREQSTIPPKRFLKATKRTKSGSTNIVRNVPYSEGSLKEAATKFKKENPGFSITKLTKDDLFRMKPRKKMSSSGKQSTKKRVPRSKVAGGELMEATARLKRQGLKGGGISQRGLGRAFMKGGRV